jgi:hypothetical protein
MSTTVIAGRVQQGAVGGAIATEGGTGGSVAPSVCANTGPPNVIMIIKAIDPQRTINLAPPRLFIIKTPAQRKMKNRRAFFSPLAGVAELKRGVPGA